MKADWHSVKLDGYPEKEGRYLVTIEGIFEDLEPGPGKRAVVTARYYNYKAWNLRDGVFRVVAWAEIPEEYSGE